MKDFSRFLHVLKWIIIQHVHVHILPRRPKDFKENDQVYDELNNHDKGPNVEWRQEEDMKREATELRLFFAKL
jgi:bis(5'-adenosyl)-triphosphatase